MPAAFFALIRRIRVIRDLIENKSELQPEIMYSDGQGQPESDFGLASLPGIRLMSQINKRKELKFYRPRQNTRFNISAVRAEFLLDYISGLSVLSVIRLPKAH